MKIRALITLCGAEIQASPGDIIEASDDQALSLVEARAAAFIEEPRLAHSGVEAAVIDIGSETADAPANRRKGHKR